MRQGPPDEGSQRESPPFKVTIDENIPAHHRKPLVWEKNHKHPRPNHDMWRQKQTSPPQQKPSFWGACYMENHHPLRGHHRLKLEHPNLTFKANRSDGRPGQAAAHISAQEEDDHQMIHPGTSSTRRRNRIGSEVIRRSSDKRLNWFFLMLYFILY